jgi:rhodanese-related sulfurtransferase
MKLSKLTFVFFMTSFLSFFGCSNTPKENNITITELHDFLEKEAVTVLDVRTPKEIAQGKITKNALEADFYDDNFITTATAEISKNETIYVYCKGGRRSGKTVVKLRELGYLKAYNVEGGIKAWKAEGYSVEK